MDDQAQEKTDSPDEEKAVSPEELEEAKKKTGLREQAQNEELIEEAKDSEGEDEHDVPSFFIEEGKREKIEIDILFDPKTGRIVSVSRVGIGVDFSEFEHLKHVVEWFEFAVPNYEDLSKYRQRSSIYHRDAGRTLVDGTQLRNFFLVWHMKDWSWRMKDGSKIELSFLSEGQLSEESRALVYALPPILVDVVMTSFERNVVMT